MISGRGARLRGEAGRERTSEVHCKLESKGIGELLRLRNRVRLADSSSSTVYGILYPRMATLNISTPVLCTTEKRLEGLQVQKGRPSEVPVRQLPIAKAGLKCNNSSSSWIPLSGIRRASRLSVQIAHPHSHGQFVAQTAAADDGLPSALASVDTRYEEQPLAAEPPTPASEQSEREQYRERANEPLGISEEESLPFGPAGGRQYNEQDPETQLSNAEDEDEGITGKDAHLMPLEGYSVTDFDSNQAGGWNDSAWDHGSLLYSTSSADVDGSNTSVASRASSESFLIERLLESLPLYDRGRSAEHYRIRALVYGKIGDYFSKGKARRYNVLDNEQTGVDVKMMTAMQQLADLILAEEGRSAGDYNCRAQFFQNSAEIFCFNDGKSGEKWASGGSEENGEEKMERVLQQLEDVMLSDSGRSIDDYSRRANVFGKTADALSGRKSGAATVS